MKKLLFIYLASISMFSFSAEIIGGISNTTPESFDVLITGIKSKSSYVADYYNVRTSRSEYDSYLSCRDDDLTLSYYNEFRQKKVFDFSKREECLVVASCLSKSEGVNLTIDTETLNVRTIKLAETCYQSSEEVFRWADIIEFDEDEQYI